MGTQGVACYLTTALPTPDICISFVRCIGLLYTLILFSLIPVSHGACQMCIITPIAEECRIYHIVSTNNVKTTTTSIGRFRALAE